MTEPKVGDIKIYDGFKYIITHVDPIFRTRGKEGQKEMFVDGFQLGLKKMTNQIENLEDLNRFTSEYNDLVRKISSSFEDARRNIKWARETYSGSIEVDFHEISYEQSILNVIFFRAQAKAYVRRLIEIRQVLCGLINVK